MTHDIAEPVRPERETLFWEMDIASPSFRVCEDCVKRELTRALLIDGKDKIGTHYIKQETNFSISSLKL